MTKTSKISLSFFILIGLVSLSFIGLRAYEDLTIHTYLGGEEISTHNEPLLISGEIYLPFRDLMYEAGLKDENIRWNPLEESVTLSMPGNTNRGLYKLNIGNSKFIMNSKFIELESPPILHNDRTYCSLDYYQYLNHFKPGFLSYLWATTYDSDGNMVYGRPMASVDDIVEARSVVRGFFESLKSNNAYIVRPFVTGDLNLDESPRDFNLVKIKNLQVDQNYLVQEAYIDYKDDPDLNSSNVLVFNLDFELSFMDHPERVIFDNCTVILNKKEGSWLIDRIEY